MAESSLQDRLRDHSKAFDGLLSLIPAKMYYGEDNSDQWQRKKQSKAEAANARRNKLDPDSDLNRNAKQVMDERAKNKRKLREMQEDEEDEDEEEEEVEENQQDEGTFETMEGVEAEQPGEGLKKHLEEPNKKQKVHDGEAEEEETQPVKLSKKEAKQFAKMERKRARKARKASHIEDISNTDPVALATGQDTPAKQSVSKSDKKQKKIDVKQEEAKSAEAANVTEDLATPNQQADKNLEETSPEKTDFSGIRREVDEDVDRSGADSEPHSPIFDINETLTDVTEPVSTTTSVSSTIPVSEKPKHIKLPADTSLLKERLAAKIEALRAARKADGTNGKPIRTRQELIESRRTKEAQRQARKKELKAEARIEEAKKREEALALNSPGMMSPAVEIDEDGAGGFSFGRVAFGDGAQLSHDLNYVLNKKKSKGPSDPKTALLKVQNQKKRLSELDEETRNDINDKEIWLAARRRAEGEKTRNDEALLKKAVKRKEVSKKKTEKAWKDRAKGVDQAQKDKQKKREANLKQRREEKMLGKAGKKKKKSGAKPKKKARPGFEGSLGISRKK